MGTNFTRVSRFKRGYSPAQVDDYMERAKEAYTKKVGKLPAGEEGGPVAFKLVAGGYSPAAVDSALDRLRSAIMKQRRAAVVAQSGKQAWLDSTYERVQVLVKRLRRPAGERFSDAAKHGYEKDSVDAFLDSVQHFFDRDGNIRAADVAGTIFPAAKKEKAYCEAEVDAFLDVLFEILLAVE